MEPAPPNILVRLLKWARRQEENYLTECLAYMVECLQLREPALAAELVRFLSGGRMRPTANNVGTVEVETQVVESVGRPDLVLRSSRCTVFVEVKKEAEVRVRQLEVYRKRLAELRGQTTALVLLTRYPVPTEMAGLADSHLRWYELGEVIELMLKRPTALDPVCRHTIEAFSGLLEARGLTMTQVSWELSAGLKALNNLRTMLAEAAAACGVSTKPFMNKDRCGLSLDGNRYWVGIEFDTPTIIGVETLHGIVDPKDAEKLGLDVYLYEKQPRAYRSIDLESEDIHFFARSRASQLQFLESYLRDSLEILRKLRLNLPKAGAVDNDAESSL